MLPVPGGETTVERAALTLSFGESAAEDWTGSIDVDKLATGTFGADKVAVALGGLAREPVAAGQPSVSPSTPMAPSPASSPTGPTSRRRWATASRSTSKATGTPANR